MLQISVFLPGAVRQLIAYFCPFASVVRVTALYTYRETNLFPPVHNMNLDNGTLILFKGNMEIFWQESISIHKIGGQRTKDSTPVGARTREENLSMP